MNSPDRFDDMPDDGLAHLRVPPHSAEAEQSVLGGLLLDNSAFDRVGNLLRDADFYRHDHRLIFAAIRSLVMANKPADVVTVHAALADSGKADGIGGLTYLNALASSVPSASNARRYAEIVREKSLRRSLIAKCDEASAMAWREDASTVVLPRVAALFDGLYRDQQLNQPRSAADLAIRRIDHHNNVASGEVPVAYATGLVDLDAALNGGLQAGRVYVIAARPSIGKSSLALQLGLHHAQRLGRGVLVLSMEMPADEVIDRAMVNLGGVDYGRLQRGGLDDADWAGMSYATELLGRLPLWIDDQPALTLADIRAKAYGLRRDGLGLIVIDYLQLCSGTNPGRGVTRNNELEEISRGIKSLAKSLGVPILLLSQLSRDVEKRATPEPTLADLRDSGAIEQDADAVLGLWFVRKWSDRKVMALSVLKNRQGELGQRIPLEFRGNVQRWEDSTADVNPSKAGASKGDFS